MEFVHRLAPTDADLLFVVLRHLDRLALVLVTDATAPPTDESVWVANR
ncbi:Uncharacterised protein [Mycobacterium tuberculosis]|nr:Uncharacterised protein [Mycobacterium tuberculosis]